MPTCQFNQEMDDIFLGFYGSSSKFNFFTESFRQSLEPDYTPLGLHWVVSFRLDLHVRGLVRAWDNFAIDSDVTGSNVNCVPDEHLNG